MPGKTLGIDHIGIAVSDLDAATKQYVEALAFVPCGGEILEDRGIEVRFLEAGESRIELIGETRDASEISKFLERRGEGIHHICIAVDDIEARLETLRQGGAQILGDGVQRGAHNTKVAFIHPKSANGVLLELVEHFKETHHG